MLFKIFYNFLLVLSAYPNTRVKSDSNEEALLSTLFNNYSSKSRPSVYYAQPTKIFTGLILNQIIDLDERNQILSTYSLIYLTWYDLRLAWNSSNYSGLDLVIVPAENVWRPDIILFNGAEKFDFLSDYQFVRITNMGEISWIPNGEIKTQCTLNVKYFPFDEQNCSISISSATFFVDQIDFVLFGDLILDYYLPNTEWTLKNNSNTKKTIKKPFPVTVVSFHLIIERKPLFFVFNLILPCVIILVVAFLAFLVPIQSGEKMSIGITTLLSIVVLLLVVADQLPPTSDSIPLISVFYAASTFIIAFICFMSVLILNIHHYGELGKPVPVILQKVFFTILGKIILVITFLVSTCQVILDLNAVRSKETSKVANINEESQIINHYYLIPLNWYNSMYLNRNYRNCCTVLFEKKPVNDAVEDFQLQWTLLADIIDRFVFYILLTATLFILLGIIGQAPNANLF